MAEEYVGRARMAVAFAAVTMVPYFAFILYAFFLEDVLHQTIVHGRPPDVSWQLRHCRDRLAEMLEQAVSDGAYKMELDDMAREP